MCDLNSPFASGKPFSALFEEQDSHDLMFYLLDKVTTLTAKYARQQAKHEGLTVSIELLQDLEEEKQAADQLKSSIDVSDASTFDSLA